MEEIKFKIKIEYYTIRVPLLGFSSSKKLSKIVEFSLSEFSEFELQEIEKKPWKYKILTIDYQKIQNLLKSLKNKIIFPYDVINSLSIEAYYKDREIQIFSKETNLPLNKLLINNRVPNSTKDIITYYRTKYYWNINTELIDQKNKFNISFINDNCIESFYVGFLGLPFDLLNNGKEIKVEIKLNDRKIEDYIFLQKLNVIKIRIYNLYYHSFYIINSYTAFELKEQFQLLHKKYPTAISFQTITKLFLNFDKNFDFKNYNENKLPETFIKRHWVFSIDLQYGEIKSFISDDKKNNFSDSENVEDYKKQREILAQKDSEYRKEWWFHNKENYLY